MAKQVWESIDGQFYTTQKEAEAADIACSRAIIKNNSEQISRYQSDIERDRRDLAGYQAKIQSSIDYKKDIIAKMMAQTDDAQKILRAAGIKEEISYRY